MRSLAHALARLSYHRLRVSLTHSCEGKQTPSSNFQPKCTWSSYSRLILCLNCPRLSVAVLSCQFLFPPVFVHAQACMYLLQSYCLLLLLGAVCSPCLHVDRLYFSFQVINSGWYHLHLEKCSFLSHSAFIF